MNPLDRAHLFANGKFRFKDPHGWKWDFVGLSDRTLIGYNEKEKDVGKFHIENCTLIARPIEDMTDEECVEFFGWDQGDIDKDRELISNYASDDGNFDSESFLYLLSIGVYPFPQSHFGDTVIDTRTLKTNEV